MYMIAVYIPNKIHPKQTLPGDRFWKITGTICAYKDILNSSVTMCIGSLWRNNWTFWNKLSTISLPTDVFARCCEEHIWSTQRNTTKWKQSTHWTFGRTLLQSQFGTIHTQVRTVSMAKRCWFAPGCVSLCKSCPRSQTHRPHESCRALCNRHSGQTRKFRASWSPQLR